VIALGRGGALETVIDAAGCRGAQAATGIFFEKPSAESLCDAIIAFEKIEAAFSPQSIRAHAQRFSTERFKQEFANFASSSLSEFRGR
jgi:glycosyltransferase involved in cell wall biosynthesis